MFISQAKDVVRYVMDKTGLIHKSHRKPNDITKDDKGTRKSDDLIKRDFSVKSR